MEWISVKDKLPDLYQKVIGASATFTDDIFYYCGEFTGVAQNSIMIKTWHFEENITSDDVYRGVKFVTHWKPLSEITACKLNHKQTRKSGSS
jgi:hypothetical protein